MILAQTKARAVGALVIVVDTIARWADVRNENDTGEMMVAMEPVEQAAAAGLALALTRHDRKSGGAVGDSGRGNTQISGTVDVISHLENPHTNGHPNRRVLTSIGRFDETPDELVIELTDAGEYINLGEQQDVERQRCHQILLDRLPADPEQAWKMSEIQELEDLKGIGRTTIQRVLADLESRHLVQKRQGSGRSHPRLFSLTAHTENPTGQ